MNCILLCGEGARALTDDFHFTVPATDKPPALDGSIGDPAWQSAAQVPLDWDYAHGGPAPEKTAVYVLADKQYLYVAFVTDQREPITDTQTANGASEGSDDEVHVGLFPTGPTGIRYEFHANPSGTRYQTSSENTSYTPTWRAVGKRTATGYTVTMAIPLEAIRSAGSSQWSAQFWRTVQASQETFEWSHKPGQQNVDTAVYAGTMTMPSHRNLLPKPRVGVYGLGQAGGPSAGGNTSRVGSDLAIPFTPSASLVATLHPDYSNVEIDQQTIQPSAFQRSFNEFRPFFTQGANYYTLSNCYGCPNIQQIYTFGIPTPASGYQLEGVQGPFQFGSYIVSQSGRNDQATGLQLTAPGNHFTLGLMHEDVNIAESQGQSPVHDVMTLGTLAFNDLHHWQGYVDYGYDRGTNILDAAQAQYEDAGLAWYTKDDFDAFSIRKVGNYYNPVDAFIQRTDLAGYSAQINHTWHYKPTSAFTRADLALFIDHYNSGVEPYTPPGTNEVLPISGTDLTDYVYQGEITTKNRLTFLAALGSSYARVPGDVLRPYSLNGFRVDYEKSPNNLNNAFASGLIGYGDFFGSYSTGYIFDVMRTVGFHVMRKGLVSFEADDTDWKGSPNLKQWLERASFSYSFTPDVAFTAGVRKIIGSPPPSGLPPTTAASTFVDQVNLSFAFSAHFPHDDIFLVYGDPNQTTTFPALIFKYVYYFGAQKGT